MYLFAMGAPVGRGHLYNVRKEQGLLYKKMANQGGGGGVKLLQETHFLAFLFTCTYLQLPNLFRTYLPKNPVAPNTVATTPLKDDLPPGPAFGK